MRKREFINQRWKPQWDDSPAFRRLASARQLVLRAQAELEAVESNAESDRRDGQLTAKGIADKSRTAVEAKVVPHLRRAQHAVAKVRQEVKAARDGMKVPKPDPTDAAGAIRRMEIRTSFRNVSDPGKIAAYLMAPDAPIDLLQAAFEVPAWVTGIDATLLANVEKAIIAREHQGEIAILDDIEEAAHVVSGAAEMEISDLGPLIGFGDAPAKAMNEWIGTVASAVDAEIAKEEKVAPKVGPEELRLAAEIIEAADRAERDRLNTYIHARNLASYTGEKVPLPDFTKPATAAA